MKVVQREEWERELRGKEGEKEVRKGLRRELGELGMKKEEEDNLGEKRVLGFEDMRAAEAETADEAITECDLRVRV